MNQVILWRNFEWFSSKSQLARRLSCKNASSRSVCLCWYVAFGRLLRAPEGIRLSQVHSTVHGLSGDGSSYFSRCAGNGSGTTSLNNLCCGLLSLCTVHSGATGVEAKESGRHAEEAARAGMKVAWTGRDDVLVGLLTMGPTGRLADPQYQEL